MARRPQDAAKTCRGVARSLATDGRRWASPVVGTRGRASVPETPNQSLQRGGLFRKYAALLVALVGGSLIVSAAIEMYYSYGESRQALIAVQREKAQSAAAVIEQFVKEIQGQVGWATGFLPAGSGLDQRRIDFLRLLRQAPAITEVSYLDADGREQIKVSRLAMDTLASGADLSQEPKFAQARANKRYLSQVYFRKEFGALSHPGDGRDRPQRRRDGCRGQPQVHLWTISRASTSARPAWSTWWTSAGCSSPTQTSALCCARRT